MFVCACVYVCVCVCVCSHLLLSAIAGLDVDEDLRVGRDEAGERGVWHLLGHHGADLGQGLCLLLFDVSLALVVPAPPHFHRVRARC